METLMLLAILIVGIASVIELIGAWALLVGRMTSNPHAFLMTISGIAAMWVAIILALI